MPDIPDQSPRLSEAIEQMYELVDSNHYEFVTPEHLLWAISHQSEFMMACRHFDQDKLSRYIGTYCTLVPDNIEYLGAEPSQQYVEMMSNAIMGCQSAHADTLGVPHVIKAMLDLPDSYARELLMAAAKDDAAALMSNIIDSYNEDRFLDFIHQDWESELLFSDDVNPVEEWRSYVTCLNEIVGSHNPLIGREAELERTILVLCRKDKNNPLHVGEAGVGKTAIAYGLAAKIEKGEVPECLAGCRIYEIDMGTMIAGTQYRGEFEKRFKQVLDGIESTGNAIVYIDEIHTVIGAGRVDGGALDASNLLKRYLDKGHIRFMGATTYDEYKRAFVNSKAFGRRFEKIDIPEPTVDECKQILRGLKNVYEAYHNVRYTDEALDYAITSADKYINGRYLPDKAIDLIDEAGATLKMHHASADEPQIVDKRTVSEALARICHIDTLAASTDDNALLDNLEQRIKAKIYGQDKAVRQLTEAVLLGSAGLIDDNKPLASLLFVGPTGVGKTEVARVLASELQIPLLRFDMSEYAEKHAVAKLIGAPAGYVGYEDGGILTDAIRKSPRCVLLFDELEKAHSGIYNILLQVMDYAVLTDNRGQKADFRHVIFIMTTNSGAQYAQQGGMGFVKGQSAGEVMMKSVKHTFKPEFINRLTDITIFNDMDERMASLILDKKLGELNAKLAAKGVALTLTQAAMGWLLKEGFSPKYGGREVDRVLTSSLKPLLMREMLFGSLRDGGKVQVDYDDKLIIKSTKSGHSRKVGKKPQNPSTRQ